MRGTSIGEWDAEADWELHPIEDSSCNVDVRGPWSRPFERVAAPLILAPFTPRCTAWIVHKRTGISTHLYGLELLPRLTSMKDSTYDHEDGKNHLIILHSRPDDEFGQRNIA